MTVQAVITADNHPGPSAIGLGAARLKRKEEHLHCFDEMVEYTRRSRPELFLSAAVGRHHKA